MAGAMLIVLAPGLLGFSRIPPAEYFRGVKVHLETRFSGTRVLAAETHPTGTVEFRAEFLARQIAELLEQGTASGSNGGWVHIVAHSMGGLDARHLVTRNLHGLAPRIASVVTVGTPHRGSP